jgi:hypothetical protein
MTVRPLELLLPVVVALVLSSAEVASAATYTVADTADSTTPCTGTTCPSLRSAVAAAVADPGSTVALGGGTYKLGNGAGNAIGDGELKITAGVTIVGAGSGATTVQQTDGQHRVIEVVAASVAISGATVTGGVLTGAAGSVPGTPGAAVTGGGILNNGTLTLDDVRVTGNKATGGGGGGSASSGGTAGGDARGGGVATFGTLTLSHGAISGNTTTGGAAGGAGSGAVTSGGKAQAALFIGPGATGPVQIRDSEVSGNTSVGGEGGTSAGSPGGVGGTASGGIVQFSQSLTLERSTVAGNTARGGAGGGSDPGAIGGNGIGGGLASNGGTLSLATSTVSGNQASGGAGGNATIGAGGTGGAGVGGGIYTQTPGTLVNDTIAANQATGGAGGMPNNPGATSGVPGDAFGGGIDDDGGASTRLTLASVTLAGNGSAGHGGNVYAGTTQLAAAGTIVASGTAPSDSNCSPGAVTADGGHNLESTTPSQCGLSAGMQDLIGADPLLQALADHGGPTQTAALGGSSPALGAGGACTDPSNANQPLTVDQRGLPRTAACDIGAFQGQLPAGKGQPQVTGNAEVGQVLTCSQGSWSGDQPLTFDYSWLRDGGAIVGAVAPQYTVGADAGHRIACQVVAANLYGSATQVSAEAAVPLPVLPDTVAPGITAFTIKPSAFVAARKGPSIVAARAGARVAFTLSEAAATTLSVERRTRGVRKRGRCRAGHPTRARNRCFRWARVKGSFKRPGVAGHNAFRFTGRVGGKRLRPGKYRLVVVATDAAGNRSKAARRPFRIRR